MSKTYQSSSNYNRPEPQAILEALPETLAKLKVDMDTYITLKNSIFPTAKDETLHMALSYCRAAKLDILQKPVHIVRMNVQNAITKQYEYRDIILPGIALYRIQASRSGTYAGISEPEFGPMITENLGGVNVTYPEWCRITVKKIVMGHICEFTAMEFWKENYARKGKKGEEGGNAPNTMWFTRPRGQLAKCTEAQGLRKTYPELFGGTLTAEEMEGKTIEGDYNVVVPNNMITHEPVDDSQLKILQDLIRESLSEESKICNFLKIDKIQKMNTAQWEKVTQMLDKKIEKNKPSKNPEVANAASEFDREFDGEES